MKILKISTLTGYADGDEVMLHAAFQILVNFMEHEAEITNWTERAQDRRLWKELCCLYNWWKKIRPKRSDPLSPLDPKIKVPEPRFRTTPEGHLMLGETPERLRKYAAYFHAVKESNRLEEEWLKEDQRNLHRLVRIRGCLWS